MNTGKLVAVLLISIMGSPCLLAQAPKSEQESQDFASDELESLANTSESATKVVDQAESKPSVKAKLVAKANKEGTVEQAVEPSKEVKTERAVKPVAKSPMTSTKKAAPASPTKADTPVADKVIAAQRQKLASSAGLAGPQSPRNIDERGGDNEVYFSPAPPRRKMNLCNIHFVKNASHAGGEFTVYAGNGDGAGNNSGYRYSGELSEAEKKPYKKGVCKGEQGALQSGDTIEVHYVHTTAAVTPGPGLESCMVESIHNPQLRIEAQVMVLVNDKNALDFNDLAAIDVSSGRYQALGLPTSSGTPVSYAGSTTGPQYNETPSPLLVTWAVRPKVVKVNIGSMPRWCRDNIFKESHAHGVRNLVLNPKLLSPIRVAPLP